MKDLIEALTIFLKYGNPDNPTHCEHDVMQICLDIDPKEVSAEDLKRLQKLGFHATDEDDDYDGGFISYRFGSC